MLCVPLEICSYHSKRVNLHNRLDPKVKKGFDEGYCSNGGGAV